MAEDIITDIKQELESGGNWPLEAQDHRLNQNPFADTWPDDRLFAGYESELRQLQRNIQRNTNTFITGPFGTGKTILTQVMYTILGDIEGFRPALVRVQKGRYSKTMAKQILRELDQDFDSSASQGDLYDLIVETLNSLHQDNISVVIFFDEVIAGSDGTLRQILHLQRDVESWEPVLVFNGTTHMMDSIHAKIEPLSDRIGDEIRLAGLDIDSTIDLVNKRLRYYCAESHWNDGRGCSHDRNDVFPFTKESVELVHQDITPYPRHLCREFNTLIEEAAEKEVTTISLDFTNRVLEKSIEHKLSSLSNDETIEVLDFLSKNGQNSINAISEGLGISSYSAEERLDTLEKEGLVRATQAGRGIRYKPTEQARKELSDQRKA
jgi:DNA-binding MarR family transcriptional regulator/type II secretory pathway predicted ATPase ExeA